SISKPVTPTLYLNDGIPSLKLVVSLQIGVAFLALIMAYRVHKSGATRMPLLLVAGLVQSFQYFYYCGYVDEVYINLEHSWNLYHFGLFSFSPTKMVDGTVELLYYATLAPFAWSHLSLIYACVGLGLMISLLHTVLVWYFVRNFPPLIQFIVTLGFAWNPIFAEIQGAGFGNGLVSLVYFLGFIAVWENHWRLATACTVILPLFRPDAVIYSMFLIIAMTLKQRRLPIQTIVGTAFGVFAFMTVVRLIYGHWILTPVLYKKTPLFEIFKGVKQQLIPLVYGLNDIYTLAICIVLVMSSLKFLKSSAPEITPENRLLARTQFLLFTALCGFYVLTNRNFFAETRRYYLPFEYFGFILLITEWGLPLLNSIGLLKNGTSDTTDSFDARPYIVATLVFLTLWSTNTAVNRWANRKNRLSDRTNLTVAWLMSREDAFSAISKLSEEIFPQNWRIAATELQGYGFMMDRDIDPLFGYANRRMALSKTLAKRGTKTDVNYLKFSKPEVIWAGRYLPVSYPTDLKPENQPKLMGGLQIEMGFNLVELVEDYPTLFVIQFSSDRGDLIETIFLVRRGNEKALEDRLKLLNFEKVADVPVNQKAIKAWSESNPFYNHMESLHAKQRHSIFVR
ncbi:MAG: hypothetical protein ACKO0V_02690, partial [bacterium]